MLEKEVPVIGYQNESLPLLRSYCASSEAPETLKKATAGRGNVNGYLKLVIGSDIS